MRYPLVITLLLFSFCNYASPAYELVKKLENTVEDTNRVILLNDIAFHYYTYNADSAAIFSTQALELAQQLLYKRGEATAYLRLGVSKLLTGQLNVSIQYLDRCLELADSIQASEIGYRAHLNMGLVYLELNELSRALDSFDKAIVGFTILNLPSLLSTAQMNKGRSLLKQKNYQEAQFYFEQSLQIGKEKHPNLGLLLSKMGELQLGLLNYKQADSLLQLAYSELITSKNNIHKGGMLLAHAEYYLALAEYQKAKSFAVRGLQLHLSTRYLPGIRDAYLILSKIENGLKDTDRAYSFLQKHLSTRDSIYNTLALERARIHEFREQRRLQRIYESEKKLEESHERSKLIIRIGVFSILIILIVALLNNLRVKHRANKKLQDINNEISNKNEALHQVHSELTTLNSELQENKDELQSINEELNQQREEIAAQYEYIADKNSKLNEAYELIEKQNKLINKENSRLEKAVKQSTQSLVEYNQQLEQYAFVTAHSLRAPVARILGLGNVLALANNNAEEQEEITKRMIETAQELDSVIHELNQILEIRKDNKNTYSHFLLSAELAIVKENLKRELQETQATIISEFSDFDEVYCIKPYIDSIFYNLISNAIKFRHPDRAPEIKISAHIIDQKPVISISDNGLGMDLNAYGHKIFKLYSRFHTHAEGRGIGLFIVKTQVMALKGSITVESTKGEGCHFIIGLSRNGLLNNKPIETKKPTR